MATQQTDILVVGAGMAGLAAAGDLVTAGRSVLVLDKGKGIGGRMATRRIAGGFFDHGVQFFTARDERFAWMVAKWKQSGVVVEWFRDRDDGEICWRGAPAMTAVPKHMAEGLDVVLHERVVRLERSGSGWLAATDRGRTVEAGSVLLTQPTAQAMDLIDESGLEIDTAARSVVGGIEYHKCLTVLALLGGPSRVPQLGWTEPDDGAAAWIADNALKGVSPVPGLTIHGTVAFSQAAWDDDREQAADALLEAASPWIGAPIVQRQIHAWRYARPVARREGCVTLSSEPALVIAGDAFRGARVESAVLSGWDAARTLTGKTAS